MTNSSQDAPKVFVSYSWDHEDHRNWVHSFASRLRDDGVDARLGDPARSSSMVAAVPLLLVCSTLFLSACAASGGSASACGRELPTVEPPQAAPGKNFVLSGGGFGEGCDDSNQPFRADSPQKDVRIGMRQDGKTWHLATVNADEDYKVEATLKVPNDAEPGRAIVVIPDPNSAEPLKVPFRVLNEPT